MTPKEALDLLKHHSFAHDITNDPKIDEGFLGMLRPFRGDLYETNFHELMLILRVLQNNFRDETIDRQLISEFWGICHLSRSWGIEEDGMLRRNNLISEPQIKLLSTWIECISTTIFNLFEGLPEDDAFESYTIYLGSKNDEV
jgi:hypothetical protein